ncbi:MAG: calcineurin-like phosphoesterase C-terminal domain-containing protein, partial [Clostridia bacterium]|nr:calcineurin-like phosphoesterase C-terminal domain-containing protein [Clostridia bacterium]
DGTPGGYKVFTKSGDRLLWYYKSWAHGKDYQMKENFNRVLKKNCENDGYSALFVENILSLSCVYDIIIS